MSEDNCKFIGNPNEICNRMSKSDNDTSEQQFKLRWNNHSNNFIQFTTEQLMERQMTDIILVSQGYNVEAHKLVLAACSPYFQEVLKNVENVCKPVIVICGVSYLELWKIVEFMYYGSVKIAESELDKFLSAAELLQVKGLSKITSANTPSATITAQSRKATFTATSDQDKQRSLNGSSSSNHPPKRACLSEDVSESDQSPSSSTSFTIRHSVSSPSALDDEGAVLSVIMKMAPKYLQKATAKQDNESQEYDNDRADQAEEVRKTPTLAENKDAETKQTAAVTKDDCWPSKLKEFKNDDKNREELKSSESGVDPATGTKIPRPLNAFMIFASEWRKKVAAQFPAEDNKKISMLLGELWHSIALSDRQRYYQAAQTADYLHKIKYPGYYYNPKEARMRKTIRLRNAASKRGSDLAAGQETRKSENVVSN